MSSYNVGFTYPLDYIYEELSKKYNIPVEDVKYLVRKPYNHLIEYLKQPRDPKLKITDKITFRYGLGLFVPLTEFKKGKIKKNKTSGKLFKPLKTLSELKEIKKEIEELNRLEEGETLNDE